MSTEQNTTSGTVSASTSLSIYPNPVKDRFTLDIESSSSDEAIISIFDLQGQLVRQVKRSLDKGSNQINLNTYSLSGGTYFITAKTHNTTQIAKMVVAH